MSLEHFVVPRPATPCDTSYQRRLAYQYVAAAPAPGFRRIAMTRFRFILSLVAVATALAFLVVEADARAGRGSSFGSRGMRTYSPPAATRTAPTRAQPIERSMTQPGQRGSATVGAAANPSAGSFLGRPGFLGGLAAGFLGAGLLGLLFGHGLMGGLGGLASVLGLLLQIVLVVIVARLIWSWWQRRSQPAFAGPAMRDASADTGLARLGLGGAAASPESRIDSGPVTVEAEDYDTFERLLGEIQTAYGKEDLNALRERVTPEMLSYFSEELADNASRGVVNQISDVKLLQGDLSEAWREGEAEYATVAMRYSLIDRMAERSSGRVIEGSADAAQEVTELWTFRRARGGNWLLSAIQQT
jgi:predicted lipid-binding transport protein (Tim44 family)